jgi:hypothetical protein
MVHLIKDKDGKSIGWELRPINEEEAQIAGTIRDLQFWGIGDTAVVYDGLRFKKDSTDQKAIDIKSVGWIQKKHSVGYENE